MKAEARTVTTHARTHTHTHTHTHTQRERERYKDKTASCLGEVVWWDERETVDADLMNAVDGLQDSTHPLKTLSHNTTLYVHSTHTQPHSNDQTYH